MRRLILQTGLSIDGYVAALDGSHPWGYAKQGDATKRWVLDSVWGAGAHLMGRVTYEEMAATWPTSDSEFARPMNEIPKVVFSRTLERADWRETRIARGALSEEIQRLRREPHTPPVWRSASTGPARGASTSRSTPTSPVRSGDATRDGAMPRTDTASRVIAAPPDRVYAALVDPGALTAWLPPDGMSGRFERFDGRPGGSYRLVLTYADASTARGKTTADSDIVEARFVDLVPGERVVQAVGFVSDDPANAGTMTMTWELTTVGAGTRVEIRAEDVPAGISAEDHAAGLRSSLAKLATYVER